MINNLLYFDRYPIIIDSFPKYEAALNSGFFPLADWRRFTLDKEIRSELQTEIFKLQPGKQDTKRSNNIFYRIAWKISPHFCEECGTPIDFYNSIHISHILTRGAHKDLAYDLRNFNLLCVKHHKQWDESPSRHTMRIYNKNVQAIGAMMDDKRK